jgi:hypothetical protein
MHLAKPYPQNKPQEKSAKLTTFCN